MAEFQNDNIEEIVENWDHPIEPHPSDALYKLLKVTASENSRLEIELNELYDNRFLDTATGVELEKIGDLVGIKRKTNEEDEKLRKRIRGGFIAQASDTTYSSFTSAALSILDTGPGAVEFITPPETSPKVIKINLDGAVLENNPLTTSELVVLLNGAVSVDAQVQIVKTGTFAFDSDDTSLEGWDEGTWSAVID